jgi:hypothetical protein
VDGSYLLLYVHILHLSEPNGIFAFWITIIASGGLLSTCSFFLSDGLACDAIEKIATLACKPLEIICSIVVPKICGGVS